MPSRRISRKDLLSGCTEPGPEDGRDPRYARRPSDRPAGSRKSLQLCRQVGRTVGAVLAGECDDDLLRDLIVESVDLAPGVGRLFVTVALAPSAPYTEPAVVLERLQQVQGRLRSEVASAITRRKAPDLIFRVRDVPPDRRA